LDPIFIKLVQKVSFFYQALYKNIYIYKIRKTIYKIRKPEFLKK